MDDRLICPRCGAELHFIRVDDDVDQEWNYFSCPDCNYCTYALSDDFTIDTFDDDPDLPWIVPFG
jgi:hypothetical protein